MRACEGRFAVVYIAQMSLENPKQYSNGFGLLHVLVVGLISAPMIQHERRRMILSSLRSLCTTSSQIQEFRLH